MKKSFYITCLALLSYVSSHAQPIPIETGGGEYTLEATEDKCLSETDRTDIRSYLRANVSQLMAEGKLSVSGDRTEVTFIWPLQKSVGFMWNSYYGISANLDQDESDGILDYHCSTRTYNGHKGTDIFTWPFPWYMYENDFVEVIAAAPGVIIGKYNGFEDDHCECFGTWNAVYVQHEDGSVAWYGHMKNGSLTDKEVGDAVVEGEFLGVVASSGCSTGPHLHLEVYDADENLIDPYAGDCNSLNADSWWESQGEFREPTINTILTHDEVPEHGCPQVNEDPHLSNDFFPGDAVITAIYFHDAVEGTEAQYRLLKPDGTLWNDWSNTMGVTYNASWWYWTWYLPDTGPFGVWTFEADYEGETVVHEFNYGVYAGLNENDLAAPIEISPNPVSNGFFKVTGLDSNTPAGVYDSAGKKVRDVVLTNAEVNVSDLEPGIYYVYFMVNHTPDTRKIVITGGH